MPGLFNENGGFGGSRTGLVVLHVEVELDRRLRTLHLPFDPVKEVHVLTDDLFQHGRYRFE